MLDLQLAPAANADQAVRTLDGSLRVDALRASAAELGREFAKDAAAGPFAVDVSALRGARLTAAVEGLLLGSYRAPGPRRPAARRRGERIDLIGAADTDAVQRGVRRGEATRWARDLANTPAAIKSPAWLAGQAVRELTAVGIDVQVHEETWLAQHGFGGVLAVGSGSPSPPRLVHAGWRPRKARPDAHVVIVGKGITFDTGGLNLKPAAAMAPMHTDMSGGAAALAALRAVATAAIPVRTTVLVPMAENSFAGGSFRPGDVIRHVGGRTSEITNTDAEGRLVLADALSYAAARLRPTMMIDIATLTGAMKVALGLNVGGLFANTDSLARALCAAGERTGEPLWRMPLAHDYQSALESSIADADNAAGNPGAITAALFLEPFADGLPWAHLDIAGPARSGAERGIATRGATGFGARLLADFVESLA